MDPRTTSRRTFLSLAPRPRSPARLAACGAPGRPRPAPEAAVAAAEAVAAGRPRTGSSPGSRSRRSARTRSSGSTPPTRRPDRLHRVPERRLQDKDQDSARRRPGPHDHLGLGRRWPRGGRQGGPGRGPHVWFKAEPGAEVAAVPGVVRGGDGRRQDLRAAGRDGHADRLLLEQEGPRQDRRLADPADAGTRSCSASSKANSKGVAPFSLGGQSRWTNMMWLEFLLDRIGGPRSSRTCSRARRTPGPTPPSRTC